MKKAAANDYLGRFREIVSDPINLMIVRVPQAGFQKDGHVYLHNGILVPTSGPHAYYGDFSSILTINRGVHEPLEEFVFQEVIKTLPTAPIMLELGAYWGHYSMWLKAIFPDASVYLVEPDAQNLMAGKYNFELNEINGEFIQAFVNRNQFEVDKFLAEKRIRKVNLLHCDIQGYEIEMLKDCANSLASKSIDCLFISTHSQEKHNNALKLLEAYNYRIEVSSDFQFDTTSYDGFIFASSPLNPSVFKDFTPLSRIQITETNPCGILEYLSMVSQQPSINE